MMRRSVLLGILIWVSVVGAASAGTWLVIDTVGQQVLWRSDSVPAQPVVPDVTLGGPTSATRSPDASPSPRDRPTHSASPTPTGLPSATPHPTRTVRPAVPGRTSEHPDPSPTAGTGPSPVERTWSGKAGSVVVRCTGADVSLQAATPADGWRVEIGSRGPAEVEVTFQGGGEVKVKARCSDGAPAFQVDGDGDGDWSSRTGEHDG